MLLLMLAAGPSLDAIDDANLALTSCGFSAFREADGQNQSLAQFRQTLSSRCSDQMSRMRDLSVQFDVGRKGMSRSAAEAAADELLADFRAGLADQYSRRNEIREQLKALEHGAQ